MGEHSVSGREAAERLGRLGIDRESARRALLSGIAGPAMRTRAAILYDGTRVDAVADNALGPVDLFDLDELPDACRTGMLVVRLSPRRPDAGPGRSWRGVDLAAPRDEQLDAARMWFRMSPWTRVLVRHRAMTRGFVPFVVTVSGFVMLGADVIGLDIDETRGAALRLTEPGDWFDVWRDRRFNSGAGGHWQWWDRNASRIDG